MHIRFRHLIAPVAVLAVLAFAPSAAADGTAVLRACLNEQSLEGFSDADKRAALNQLAADQDEYSDCRSVIGASIGAKKVKAGISSNTPPAPGSAPPQDPQKVRRAAAQKKKQVREARRQRARKAREEKLGRRAVDPQDAG
ncbi:MAG: hypothetical protein ACRDN8_00620, partial [Thermoleophilaceae bacterium]